ncbi:cobyrinate a,c-diamide synthase [Ferrimonas sediminicola]|uniref:Cobyrinate a,c-diamide synthase n=1 Tax=Ferrimonas sediminicola TaxID=2569538 RepID=A0A4U1BJJ3_9GAMM|nr:cobyrinate a,c-diamide synthase [Ferrimonas sediminicola]TKB50280.1 cobyrinate a,c-diamide synthase [Ferrimonas sediminicola]
MSRHSCPALLVTAPSSDSGKTTVVAALARYWRNRGKRVRVFKTGPDFIDPIFHEVASGAPAHQLDLGMMGEAACRRHLAQAATEADLILIEGVMGMFDGHYSSADLAARFGVPTLAVIPAAKMAQTFGAIACGLAHYREGVTLFGVVANQVGGPGHAELLKHSLPETIEFCGWLPRDDSLALPDRHLGLVQATEIPDLEAWLDGAAAKLGESCAMPLPAPVVFDPVAEDPALLALGEPLGGRTVAVAEDAAFAFIYRDNLSLLRRLGADLVHFSPLKDPLPACDALYLPGGYPELHREALVANRPLMAQIRAFADAGKPVVAECGGMLYLLEQLADKEGQCTEMTGVLPGRAQMQPRLQGIGMLSAEIGGHSLRGHCFHYSSSDIGLEPIAIATQAGRMRASEPVYRQGSVVASYVHWYFPSAPALVADWFGGRCR